MDSNTKFVEFEPREDCSYKFDYPAIFAAIAREEMDERETFRTLVLNDLFFIVFFIMGIKIANHPFVVDYCRDVEEGTGWHEDSILCPENSPTMDWAAREHFKSTIITKAWVIQQTLRDPENRIAIFSHTKAAAKAFLRPIMLMFEENIYLRKLFPDVLWDNPRSQAPKWSEDEGIVVKRSGFYHESSIEAAGLIEGMPTGKHYTIMIFDDVETADYANSPTEITKLCEMFDLAMNLGTMDGVHWVIGTPYTHNGLLTYIRAKKNPVTLLPVYRFRMKPATRNGKSDGEPVLLTQERLDSLKANAYVFNCQQLLNPSPTEQAVLRSDLLKAIDPKMIPKNCFSFMTIDTAGDITTLRSKDTDFWSFMRFDVEPVGDQIGLANVYITDMVIDRMSESQAIETFLRMYMAGKMVFMVGIEKFGVSSFETHMAHALAAKGRMISEENKSLKLFIHNKTSKAKRIEATVSWPLNNGKIHYSTKISDLYVDRLKQMMDKFPVWHDDGLDTISYLYEMLVDFVFPTEDSIYQPIKYAESGVL